MSDKIKEPLFVKIQGDPNHRRKVRTIQIQKSNEPKTKAPTGRKPNKKEIDYIRAKRLQAFTPIKPAETINPSPKPPKKLQPLSEEEKQRRINNLQDTQAVQCSDNIPEDFLLNNALPNKNNFVLHPHQMKVVLHMLNNRGLIAWNSVGSGKTLIAAVSATVVLRAFPYTRVLFVGPKSLLSNFKNTINNAYKDVEWNRIDLYTYEKFHRDYLKGLIDSNNTYLIIDEAHRLRTSNSSAGVTTPGKTTKSIMLAARKAGKVLLLTATPVVNEPYDIVPLVAILKGETNLIHKTSFYRNVYSKKGTMVNQERFNNMFSNTMHVYVRPEDDTFPKVEIHRVDINMTQKYYKEYQRVEEQLISDIQRKVLGPSDLEPFYNGVRRTVNADIEEFNPKLDWIRQHLLKFNNRKMVIFSPFISLGVEQLKQVVQDYDVPPTIAQITGSDTARARQEVINKYNNDEIQVLIISVGAGGLGINLIGTRDVVITQAGWNEVQQQQAIGRAIRFKSHTHLPPDERKVEVWNLFLVKPKGYNGKKSIDEIILEINDRKNKIIRPFERSLRSAN